MRSGRDQSIHLPQCLQICKLSGLFGLELATISGNNIMQARVNRTESQAVDRRHQHLADKPVAHRLQGYLPQEKRETVSLEQRNMQEVRNSRKEVVMNCS